MGQVNPFTKVQLFTGIIVHPNIQVDQVYTSLESEFGLVIDSVSDLYEFDHSTYYQAEMGKNLKRLFVSFKDIVSPDLAYKYKVKSNRIETLYVQDNRRSLNIDPGILSLHNILLFSTKNFSHRIACGQGIYIELTLLFRNDSYVSLDWTYPDFKQSNIQDYFLELRKRYHKKLN